MLSLSRRRLRSGKEEGARTDTVYGLAAGVWTTNIKRAHKIANQLRAGTVWVTTRP